jgi:hypothetical protein
LVLPTESFPKNVSSTSVLIKFAELTPHRRVEFLAIKLFEISVSVIVSFAISAVHTCPSVISDAFTEFAARSDAVRELSATSDVPTLFGARSAAVSVLS